jgi:hypothetical protein
VLTPEKINALTKDELSTRLLRHPEYILQLKDPDEDLRKIALTERPDLISELHAPTEADYMAAVREDGLQLRHLLIPSNSLISEALRQNGIAIQYVQNPTRDQQKAAVLSDPFAIQHIKSPHADAIALALKSNGLAIQFIERPTEPQQLLAVKAHPSAISLIDQPTKKVLRAAIENNGLSIEFYDRPAEDLQLLAIESSPKGLAIRYITNPTPKAQEVAYFKNKANLKYLPSPTERVQLDAVNADPENVQWFKPSKKVQQELLKRVKSHPRIFDLVGRVDDKVMEELLDGRKFQEKAEKKLDLPEDLTLEQLRVYRFLDRRHQDETTYNDLKKEPWAKDSPLVPLLRKAAKKGIINKTILAKTRDKEPPSPEEGLGSLIHQADVYSMGFEDRDVFDQIQKAYAVGLTLKDLSELPKDLRVALKKIMREREDPYISHILTAAYVQYTLFGQNVWIHSVKVPALEVLESNKGFEWVPEWLLSKFIRDMRYRAYQKFYVPNSNLREQIYDDPEKVAEAYDTWAPAYLFTEVIIRGIHPLVNGKESWALI